LCAATTAPLLAPKRFADFARAFIASVSRVRGGVFVTNESSKCCAACPTSSTARLNAASFACDGFVNPQSFRTNCDDDARISSLVAGGSKLRRVLILRHMTDHLQLSIQDQLFRDADVFWFGEEPQGFFAAFAADAALFHADRDTVRPLVKAFAESAAREIL
jgi:hypothetical protein